MVKPLASAITGASGGEDIYAANSLSPDYVADFSATSADYFRVAGNDSDFETAFTSDSEGGGLATMVDSSGNLVWRAHNLFPHSQAFGSWSGTGAAVSDAAVAPDGSTTADQLTFTSGQGRFLNRSGGGNQACTGGIWVKAPSSGAATAVRITINNGSGWFSGPSTKVTLTGDWQFVSYPATASGTNQRVVVGTQDETSAADPDCVGAVLVWGNHVYRSDLGGMAAVPADQRVASSATYVPTTTAARYLARRRHHRWDGAAWVPTCLHEPIGATNLDPNSDDLSAWTTSNTTIAKNQTGADGVANSAHSITATANSGTALEQITAASAAHAWGCLMKRITGTGTVEVTVDGGSTWVDITSDLSTSVFLQVSTGAGITVTNPEFGVRLGTSGDVVAVQVSQLEQTSGFISSPIPTNGSTVVRTADTLKGKAASLPYSSTAISMAVQGRYDAGGQPFENLLAWYAASTARITFQRVSASLVAFVENASGGGSELAVIGSYPSGPSSSIRAAGRWVASTEVQGALNGTAGVTEGATMPAMPALSSATLRVNGTGLSAGETLNGTVDTIRLWDEDIAEAGIEEATA